MAIEETGSGQDEAAAAATKTGNGLLKAVGITLGLFIMMLVSQLVSPILGCSMLASVTPNCPAPAVVTGADGQPAAAPKGPPLYLAMDPPLVASLQDNGTIRFFQVSIEIMARDEKALTEVQELMPIVRNNLLMLFGGQSLPTLTDRDQKEELRQAALDEVRKIVRDNRLPQRSAKAGPRPDIEDLYFTSFVVQ